MPALTPGQRLSHYEIVAPIGAGGMGEVYVARGQFSERFEREGRSIAALKHPPTPITVVLNWTELLKK